MWNYEKRWVCGVEVGKGIGHYREGPCLTLECRFDSEEQAIAFGQEAWKVGVNMGASWGVTHFGPEAVLRVQVWHEYKHPDTLTIAGHGRVHDLKEIPKPD